MEAHELVNEAVDVLLSGQRAWVPGEGQDHAVRILATTMRSLVTLTAPSGAVRCADSSSSAP